MHEGPRHRTGGRAGRMAARLAAHIEAAPFLTRALRPFEVLDEEGLTLIEEKGDSCELSSTANSLASGQRKW